MTGQTITVFKLKPTGEVQISYAGEVLERGATHVTLRAPWLRGAAALGYVTLEPGDVFVEHYYADRWYNVFAISGGDGRFKGWYCNITRPAHLTADTVRAEDLALDLWVAPDGQMQVLDEDEFETLALGADERRAAREALAELQRLAREGRAPFVR